MDHNTHKRTRHTQPNTYRPKPIVRDGNSNANATQGAWHELLLPVLGLEEPRQLRGHLRRRRREIQYLLRGKLRTTQKIPKREGIVANLTLACVTVLHRYRRLGHGGVIHAGLQ